MKKRRATAIGGAIPLAIEAIRAGAAHLIEKPFKNAELIATLEDAHVRFEAWQPVAAARAKLNRLSRRERDGVTGLVSGSSHKDIGRNLRISPRTVEVYRSTLSNKLVALTLADIVRVALTAESNPGNGAAREPRGPARAWHAHRHGHSRPSKVH